MVNIVSRERTRSPESSNPADGYTAGEQRKGATCNGLSRVEQPCGCILSKIERLA